MRLLLLPLLAALIAAPSLASAEDDKPVAGWDKGFFIQSPDGKFLFKPRGRVQVRYTFGADAGEDGREYASGFVIQRLRIGFRGHLVSKAFTYRIEMDFGKGRFAPKYMYLDYAIKPGRLQVRAGHFKRPWSREQLTGSDKQALVDRSITDKAFGAGYDLGVMLHNGSKERLEWAVALTNGGSSSRLGGDVSVDLTTGEGEITGGRFSNEVDLFQPTTTIRVGYNHAGVKGYEALDTKGEGFRFAVGGGAQMSFDLADEQDGWFGANVDAIVKVRGFSATTAVYVSTAQGGEGWTSQELDDLGLHFQAAYLVQGKVAPALLYARVQSLSDPDDVAQELGGGVHVLFFERNITWSTDFSAIGGGDLAPAGTDFRLRTQAQVQF